MIPTVDDTPVPDFQAWQRADGQTFLVFGAGNGIGRQTAHAAASAGALVVCVDRDPSLASRVAEEVNGLAVAADITKRADVQRAFDKAVSASGKVDSVIDIVGIGRADDIVDLTDDTWAEVFQTCFHHAFLVMQIGARTMRETGGGAMAFVSSISGMNSAPRHAPYGAAKAAMNSLVRSAAIEFAQLGIRVNAIAPGPTATPRLTERLESGRQGGMEAWLAAQPTGRLTEPAEIAAGLLFLTTRQSANTTGRVLVIDGGLTSKYAFDEGVPDVTVAQAAATSNS